MIATYQSAMSVVGGVISDEAGFAVDRIRAQRAVQFTVVATNDPPGLRAPKTSENKRDARCSLSNI